MVTTCITGPSLAQLAAYTGTSLSIVLAHQMGVNPNTVSRATFFAGCLTTSPGRKLQQTSTSAMFTVWFPDGNSASHAATTLRLTLTANSAADASIAAQLAGSGEFPLTLVTSYALLSAAVAFAPPLPILAHPPHPPNPPPYPPLAPYLGPGYVRRVNCASLALRPGQAVPHQCLSPVVAPAVVGAVLGVIALWVLAHATIHCLVGRHLRRTSVTLACAVRCDCSARLFDYSAADEDQDVALGGFAALGSAGIARSTTEKRIDSLLTHNGKRFAAPLASQAIEAAAAGLEAPPSATAWLQPTVVVRPLYRAPLLAAYANLRKASPESFAGSEGASRLTTRFAKAIAPRGSPLNRVVAAASVELSWQRRELRHLLRRMRRASTRCLGGGGGDGNGHTLRLVTASPGMLLGMGEAAGADGAESAALFCLSFYFGLRGEAAAEAFRAHLKKDLGLSAAEAAIEGALERAGDSCELSDVGGVWAVLLDDLDAGTLSDATSGRVETLVRLSSGQSRKPLTALSVLRRLTSRLGMRQSPTGTLQHQASTPPASPAARMEDEDAQKAAPAEAMEERAAAEVQLEHFSSALDEAVVSQALIGSADAADECAEVDAPVDDVANEQRLRGEDA